MTEAINPQWLISTLRKVRYPTTTEAALQDAIEQHLQQHQIPHVREHRMGPTDRIDFMVDGDIGLEAKTRYPRRRIYRQLERYCTNHQLRCIILVTGTYLGLPPDINGVPLFMVSTGRAAL